MSATSATQIRSPLLLDDVRGFEPPSVVNWPAFATDDASLWIIASDAESAEWVLACKAIATLRSWVVWKPGPKADKQHLLYFVRDAKRFRFYAAEPALRIPSARQTVYGDSRAASNGRLPDDTWLIGSTPKRATFVEAPRALWRRIIVACSQPFDAVYVGSRTPELLDELIASGRIPISDVATVRRYSPAVQTIR